MTDPSGTVQPGPDGRLRCPWAMSSPEYLGYHDDEWGRPVRTDQGIFERLCLEGFQAGLSWLTILRKRENFRVAFHGFDLAQVAGFGPADVDRLLGDAGIIRNRSKIQAAIRNARAALDIPAGLAALVWSYAVDPGPVAPVRLADLPASTPASAALAKDLRGRGFTFTGPVTVYATFQACGLVDDHLRDCFRRGAYRALARIRRLRTVTSDHALLLGSARGASPPEEDAAVTGKPTVAELGVDLDAQEWRRSGDRDGAIEIAFVPAHALAGAATTAPLSAAAERTEYVLMRVAGDPAGRVLVYDRHEWECFLDGVRGGEFDQGAS